MSLLSDAMERYVIINAAIVDDGYGGYITQYSEGATFDAAVTKNTSIQAEIAKKQGVTALYTVLTKRDITLTFGMIIKRVSDGMYFRITSSGIDDKTPKSAGLDIRKVSAEEYTLPTD